MSVDTNLNIIQLERIQRLSSETIRNAITFKRIVTSKDANYPKYYVLSIYKKMNKLMYAMHEVEFFSTTTEQFKDILSSLDHIFTVVRNVVIGNQSAMIDPEVTVDSVIKTMLAIETIALTKKHQIVKDTTAS